LAKEFVMASHDVIRTVKGHQYRYREKSIRIPGVRTPRKLSIYLGPVDGGGRREGNQAAMYTDPDKMAANAKALSEGKPVDGNGTPIADAGQENAPSGDAEGEASE
jgi:hypothetical protein